MDCIYGGPHTYSTVTNDTFTKIALKFNVTVNTLAALLTNAGVTTNDEIVAAGTTLKIPQCSPSQCTIQPYRFNYGTYVDLAAEFNTTVGQISAFNAGYTTSDATTNDTTPVLTIPMNCVPLSDTITVIT
jgi:hypothetical protein